LIVQILNNSVNPPQEEFFKMPRNSLIKVRNGIDADWASADPVLAIGEPGFSSDKGSLKIGDGVTAYSSLPDFLDGKFPNIITVSKTKPANFVCSKYASDDLCIQAAVDKAISLGINTVEIMDGVYNLLSQVTSTHSITLRGIGDITFVSNSLTSHMISFAGTIKATTVPSTIAINSNTLTVADASTAVAGDLVFIYSDEEWGTFNGYVQECGEIHEILSVSGSVITISENVLREYSTTNNAAVKIIDAITVNLENIKFAGASATLENGMVSLKYIKNSKISNCQIDKGGLGGFNLNNSYNVHIIENKIKNCSMDGQGYGVSSENACAHIMIHDNRFDSCRHCIATTASGEPGQPRDIHVYNNHFYCGTMEYHVIDAHQIVESIYVYNNIIHNGTGYAFVSGARNSHFVNNTVYGGYGTTTRGPTQDMIFVVDNNTFYNCTNAFYDGQETFVPSIKYASVRNNKMIGNCDYIAKTVYTDTIDIISNRIEKSVLYGGIYLENAKHGIISNNLIQNSYRSGIYLKACSDVAIKMNTVENSNIADSTADTHRAGIGLVDCTHINVENNTVSDINTRQRYAIREFGTSNSNVIKNNTVSGALTSQIYRLGIITRVENNPGFNPVGSFTAPTLPASAEIYTNSYGYPCSVLVTGGTVTGISLGGTPTGLTSGMFTVPAGTTIAITYSAAPTWKWWGL
jgi:parallel beta-helix repeat protein